MTDQGRSITVGLFVLLSLVLTGCQSTGTNPPCEPEQYVQPAANGDCIRFRFPPQLV